MKKRVQFLFTLFFLMSVISNVFGQQISVNGTNYTNTSVNVTPNTQLTLVATLPTGAAQTYWTAVAGMSATTPNQVFPILNPQANTVVLNAPATAGSYTVTVYFADASGNLIPGQDVFVTLAVSTPTITGLLTTQQNLVGCQNIVVNVSATGGPQLNYTYVWQEWSGSAWIALGTSSYYSAIGHNIAIQYDASLVGKRFRCNVSIDDFIGSTISTSEIVVNTVNPLPAATFTNVNICAGNSATLQVTPTAGTAPWTVSMLNGTADLVAPSNTSPIVTSGIATFTVAPTSTTTYDFRIVDNNRCSKDFVQ